MSKYTLNNKQNDSVITVMSEFFQPVECTCQWSDFTLARFLRCAVECSRPPSLHTG